MKYQIVLSDPPWQQTKGNLRKCRPNQGKSLDYETLSLSEIKQIHKDVSESLCLTQRLAPAGAAGEAGGGELCNGF